MRVLTHKASPWDEYAYGLVALGIAIGLAIGLVCFPPSFRYRGAPVFATEASSNNTVDFADRYAENAAGLHNAYVERLNLPPNAEKKNGTLDTTLNALEYHGAAWGLREGRVDYISLKQDADKALLGVANPHIPSDAPVFKRPLDGFEAGQIGQLGADEPVVAEIVEGRLRVLGLVPNAPQCAACHDGPRDNGRFFGVFSYHFTEIADD